ncbi:hypothetical protein BVC80_1801g14 [Macleaya cordata]|uniref:Uncharacterized protein n=1 Tax=Macleaya cordata TaxID=56857 RepID=A0A200PMK8_MACCD|nr:hypothetical protein BVC80_1801g14 [Macleaya cordata]
MNREQSELRSVGFFGIYKEAYKITVSRKKLFSQITLVLVLPLSILYLSQIQISNFIQTKTYRHHETSRWIAYGITEAIYIIFLFIFSLLSTSVVSYTIACIYTSKEIMTFKKVISVVPRLCMRLMVTFLWCFFILTVHTGVALGLLIWFTIKMFGPEGEGANKVLIFIICLSIPYFIGLVFINVVWHLASVISVLEKNYGRKALKKSIKLIKGKILVSCAIFTMLEICFSGILATFSVLVVYGYIIGTVGRVGVGILCYLLLTIYFHFALIIQTVVYFVCKSYHQEDFNKFDKHLEISFVPLSREKDIPL